MSMDRSGGFLLSNPQYSSIAFWACSFDNYYIEIVPNCEQVVHYESISFCPHIRENKYTAFDALEKGQMKMWLIATKATCVRFECDYSAIKKHKDSRYNLSGKCFLDSYI